ncbi:transposase [uncultured Desulfuromusa sp.]|uniref:REP-associated tyrosine transposase n=1 Tax=uncultured Desulfuromusa sp. TaxID=219183 RepID=UPI002AA6F01E|nr:transposase [uncultured Desulfuromusa sp.]
MARALRIQYPGAYYHVTSRGNERKDIYKSRRDREKFLSYLESATDRYGALIHGYCLMSNHYHLLLETPEGNLSQIMRHINGAYTTYYNVKRKRSGHLFQGRYHAVLIEADAHITELSRYLHLNPVRAGMVDKPDEHPWSSYQAYIGKTATPQWLRRDFILGYFGKNDKIAQQTYRSFVEDLLGESYESPLKNAFGNILGDKVFVEEITEQHLRGKEKGRDVPALSKLKTGPAVEEIISKVESSIQNDEKRARQVSLYLCHRYSGSRLRDLGNHFNVGESGISEASRRFGARLEKDASLRAIVETLRSQLNV